MKLMIAALLVAVLGIASCSSCNDATSDVFGYVACSDKYWCNSSGKHAGNDCRCSRQCPCWRRH